MKLKIEYKKIEDITPYINNPRKNEGKAIDKVAASIKEFGFKNPIVVDREGVIINGHTRYKASKKLGLKEVPTIAAEDLTPAQVKAFRIADNKVAEYSDWDDELLKIEFEGLKELNFDLDITGFENDIIDCFEENDKVEVEKDKKTLMDKFLAPPFSVIDTKKGYWIERKKAWIDLGIKSEDGREVELMPTNFTKGYEGFENNNKSTSIFDPVLCELIYKWFNVENGSVLDPFAGGSVRGIVAEKLGYKYIGIDIREEQIKANEKNAKEIGVEPNWICEDSLNIDNFIEDNSKDLFFTCPPYADLEVYSNNSGDISNKEYEIFIKLYENIISKTLSKIKENRFAVIVVGDVRDKKGFYRDFISHTKNIFIKNGFYLYNELILLQRIGSAVLRADKQFRSYRKNVKIHENVLVFYKGDVKKIKENYKDIEILNIEEE